MSLRTVLPIHIGAIAAAARAITGLGRLIRDNAYKYTGPAPTPGRNPYGEALQRALENLKNSSGDDVYPDDWGITDKEYYNKYYPNNTYSSDDPFDPKILEDYRNVDPVVLDLNGDGIYTVGMNSFAYFDHDGNGFAEKTGWIARGNGLLVMDRDGNGSIDTGKELFGDQTILANGNKAKNGFEALAELDTNHDGKIDVNDTAWSKLLVWADNGNGITEDGELKTLDELGIQSLNLDKTNANMVDEQVNTKFNNQLRLLYIE